MQPDETSFACLILPDARPVRLDPALHAAAGVLDRHDPDPRRPVRIRRDRQAVLGPRLGLRMRQEDDSAYGPRLVVEVLHRPGTATDTHTTARLLSDAILAVLSHCDADLIACHGDGTLIDREDFIRRCRMARPEQDSAAASHAKGAEAPGPGDASLIAPEQRATAARAPVRQFAALAGTLRTRIAARQPAQLRLGAASWAMTGMLCFLSVPVAAALAVFGLLRGMDFRLTTQTLSVTMLFVALQNAQAF
jgi:hypothetical protein